jgi:hypothetical protein
MTVRGRRGASSALLMVFGALVWLVGNGPASPTPARAFQPPTTGAQARGFALRDASHRLKAFPVLPGATRLPEPPAGFHLGAPPDRPEAHKLIDLHQLWRTEASMPEVMSWFRLHRPDESFLTDEGQTIFRGTAIRHVFSFGWRELEPLARNRVVLLSVAPDPSGGSVYRLDSQAEWTVPHPREERIPPGAHFLKIERIVYRPKQKTRVKLHDPRRIHAVAKLINELPVVGPYATGHEERLTGEYKLTFRTREGGKQLANVRYMATTHFGYSIDVTVPKRHRSAFVSHYGGRKFIRRLEPYFAGG